jgi:hypothetical protein
MPQLFLLASVLLGSLFARTGLTIVVTDVKANLRAGPGTDYDLLGALAYGDTAPATGRSAKSDWVQIAYAGGPGGRAWVWIKTIEVQGGAVNSLPVIDPPPTPTLPPTARGEVGPIPTLIPTRLPTFTPPPPVPPVSFTEPPLGASRFPLAAVILGLFAFGLFSGMMAFVRRNKDS